MSCLEGKEGGKKWRVKITIQGNSLPLAGEAGGGKNGRRRAGSKTGRVEKGKGHEIPSLIDERGKNGKGQGDSRSKGYEKNQGRTIRGRMKKEREPPELCCRKGVDLVHCGKRKSGPHEAHDLTNIRGIEEKKRRERKSYAWDRVNNMLMTNVNKKAAALADSTAGKGERKRRNRGHLDQVTTVAEEGKSS